MCNLITIPYFLCLQIAYFDTLSYRLFRYIELLCNINNCICLF